MTDAVHAERREISAAPRPDERGYEERLRPAALAEMIGQNRLRENLGVFVAAARERGEALDHLLFYGPPGLGKTSLARIVAREMGAQFRATSGPVLERSGDLAGLLSNLERATCSSSTRSTGSRPSSRRSSTRRWRTSGSTS